MRAVDAGGGRWRLARGLFPRGRGRGKKGEGGSVGGSRDRLGRGGCGGDVRG